ncbi:MAG: hypothetical protein OER88_01395 [Planctomycetota bacterium]|nr:hypothetical protein [Planctomycetota bacterium]
MRTPSFPHLEQPCSLCLGPGAHAVALDRQGRRLWWTDAEGARAIDLSESARACRLHGREIILLTDDDELVRLDATGARLASMRLNADARAFAITPGGSAIVVYGRRGVQEHGVVMQRLSDSPLEWTEAPLLDAVAVACGSGEVWVAGTGTQAPLARAIRLRPVPGSYKVLESVALPRPPRAAAVGPDGALYLVLEPGESIMRVHRGQASTPRSLSAPVRDVARGGGSLWGCGPRGLVDLTGYVPAAPDPIEFTPPPCSP